MARRRIGVADVKEILVQWDGGEGMSRIARTLGYSRTTVRKYVRAAGQAGAGARRRAAAGGRLGAPGARGGGAGGGDPDAGSGDGGSSALSHLPG